jgi:hypothetical protein
MSLNEPAQGTEIEHLKPECARSDACGHLAGRGSKGYDGSND